MILPLLIEYLTNALEDYFDPILSDEHAGDILGENPSVYVGVEAPEQLSGYVLVDQTGSDTVNHITTSTVTVQSYGPSLYAALLLSETVKSFMFGFASEDAVAAVKLETDYNFTDTSTKQYRWQAVYRITHYLGGC